MKFLTERVCAWIDKAGQLPNFGYEYVAISLIKILIKTW
jgi:hypothetical protein